MFKTNNEIISIEAKATDPISTGVVFWSHDKGTAKMIFRLKKENVNQTLSEGTIIPILLEFLSATAENGRGRHIYHAVIEDAINGIVSIVLEDNILGYQGRVDGSIYIELPDKRSLDTAGRFSFEIKRSPIDEEVPELEDYYWQGFNEIMEKYHQTIAGIKSEAKELLDSLKQDVSSAQEKVSQLEQSISTANTNLNARIDEISKKIDEHDVFTKAESSANVINSIGGTELAILKKEFLVNGTEATASRYVKDLPYENYVKNSGAKEVKMVRNGATNWIVNIAQFPRTAESMLGKTIKIYIKGKLPEQMQGLEMAFQLTGGAYPSTSIRPATDNEMIFNGDEIRVTHSNFSDNAYARIYVRDPNGVFTEAPTIQIDWVMITDKPLETPVYYPAAEDMGIVHGQPNLLDGTSNEWEDIQLSNWQSNEIKIPLEQLGLKVGDTISAVCEIDYITGSDSIMIYVVCKDSSSVNLKGLNPTRISSGGNKGVSKGEMVIPENTKYIAWGKLGRQTSNGETIVAKVRNHKLIKGSLAAMDEWTPSQSDSGLTPVNGGKVSFTDDEYATLFSEDGVVRGETLMVGRGAEIEFPFDVIGTLERKYPYLFEECTSMTEKMAKFKSIQKSIVSTCTLMAGGQRSDNLSAQSYRSLTYIKYRENSYWALGVSEKESFGTIKRVFESAHLDCMTNDGKFIIYAVSKKNGSADWGTVSDGVSSAWVEVKDIRLTIELEVNGRTIIESMIATYHRENLATQEEAESGESDEKLMTPLTTKQSIEKHSVLLQGDQDIDGIKNYLEMPTFEGKRFLTSDDLALLTPLWTGASFLSAAHTITLPKSIADCKTGIVLKFNPYNSTSGTAYTSQTSWWLIPKHHVLSSASGQNTFCPIFKQDGTLVGAKVVTVGPNKLTGADVNALGALYGYVLTGVYEA